MKRHSHELARAILHNDLADIERIVSRHGAAVLDEPRLPSGRCALSFALLHGMDDCVRACLRLGARPDFPYNSRRGTVLHALNQGGVAEHAEAFIAAGADVNARDEMGDTPLACAIRVCDETLVRALLAAGATLESPDPDHPLLHQAALSGRAGIAQALVEYGADLRARNADGFDALEVAVQAHADAVASYLRSRFLQRDPATPSAPSRPETGPAL